MSYNSERYEVEVQDPENGEIRFDFRDVDEAMSRFYREIANNFSEPSYSVAIHDLVAGRCLACWQYDPNDDVGKVLYDTPTPVLGN